MKKLTAALAAVALFLCILPVQTVAAENVVSRDVTYYADGSYSVVTITVDEQNEAPARATTYKTGTKVYNYYSDDGTIEWKMTLKATFSYTGSTSSCTSVDNVAVNIYDSDWSMLSKSSSKSGNTATANVTMGKTQVVGTYKVPVTLTLSCDKNGNLS